MLWETIGFEWIIKRPFFTLKDKYLTVCRVLSDIWLTMIAHGQPRLASGAAKPRIPTPLSHKPSVCCFQQLLPPPRGPISVMVMHTTLRDSDPVSGLIQDPGPTRGQADSGPGRRNLRGPSESQSCGGGQQSPGRRGSGHSERAVEDTRASANTSY